jgi:gliding motility-associated-like protein
MLCTGVCNGSIHTELIGGTPPYYYSWSNGSQKANIENLCEDDYELTIKDKNNCTLTRSFTIINQDYIPDLSVAASDTIIYRGQSVNLLALSSSSGYYIWDYSKFLSNLEISNPIATPDDTTIFYVKFTDLYGCKIRDSIKIYVKEVICGDPYIYVPNAFTPNNDGKNDYFKPYYPYGLVTEVFFVVYDRWGNIVFQTDEIWTKGWDGTYRGEQLTSDVYVYFLRARCLNGEEYSHKGNVTLLR